MKITETIVGKRWQRITLLDNLSIHQLLVSAPFYSGRCSKLHAETLQPFVHRGSVSSHLRTAPTCLGCRMFSWNRMFSTNMGVCGLSAPACVSAARLCTWACISIHNTVSAALRQSESCDVYSQRDEKGEERQRIDVSHVSHDTHTHTLSGN